MDDRAGGIPVWHVAILVGMEADSVSWQWSGRSDGGCVMVGMALVAF